MAKNMALVEDGVVVNILWCSSDEPQTDTLLDIADRPVGIGDTYEGGAFYRDGVKVLTPLEALRQELDELDSAYAEGVNSV